MANSRKAERDRAHRVATRAARCARCLVCGRDGCIPAHWPKHRGLGGGGAGWEPREWIPLCVHHHDLIDKRLGVSVGIETERLAAIAVIEDKAPRWWRWVEKQEEL